MSEARLGSERDREAALDTCAARAGVLVGGCWKQSMLPFGPSPPSQQLARLGQERAGTGLRPAQLLLPSQRTHQPLFFPMDQAFRQRVRQKQGALAPLCYDSSTPSTVAGTSPECACEVPPRISCPTAANPPVSAGRAGRGKRFPRAMTPSYFSPTWRRRWLRRGYCRSGSRSLLLQPHSPSPSAASAPPAFPRPATQLHGHLGKGAGPPVQQEPVRVLFVSSAPALLPRPPAILQAGGYVLAVWIPRILLIPSAGEGSECFRCSPRVAGAGLLPVTAAGRAPLTLRSCTAPPLLQTVLLHFL